MFVARFVNGPWDDTYMDIPMLHNTIEVRGVDESRMPSENDMFPTKKGFYGRVETPERKPMDNPGLPFDYVWCGWS